MPDSEFYLELTLLEAFVYGSCQDALSFVRRFLEASGPSSDNAPYGLWKLTWVSSMSMQLLACSLSKAS